MVTSRARMRRPSESGSDSYSLPCTRQYQARLENARTDKEKDEVVNEIIEGGKRELQEMINEIHRKGFERNLSPLTTL